MAKSVTISALSNLKAKDISAMSLSVATHENAGATATQAPVLMSVQSDAIYTAADFAKYVASKSSDLDAAMVARVLNAQVEAIKDIIDQATEDAAPSIDLGWGKLLFEIGGSLENSTSTPGTDNTCFFSGSPASEYQRQYAQMNAYVDTGANPCDFKRVIDVATSAQRTIVGTNPFYMEGRGMKGSARTAALYSADGTTKVVDITLDAAACFENSLKGTLPNTVSIPVGDYVCRVETTIAGTVYRMEKPVTVSVAVVAPPTMTTVEQGDRAAFTVRFDGTDNMKIGGTNLASPTKVWFIATNDGEDYECNVTSKIQTGAGSATQIIVSPFENVSELPTVQWPSSTVKLYVTTASGTVNHAVTFVAG